MTRHTHNRVVLSSQQLQCANYLIQGKRIKEIAESMKLSPRTVEHYFSIIKTKLDCKNKTELILAIVNYFDTDNR